MSDYDVSDLRRRVEAGEMAQDRAWKLLGEIEKLQEGRALHAFWSGMKFASFFWAAGIVGIIAGHFVREWWRG